MKYIKSSDLGDYKANSCDVFSVSLLNKSEEDFQISIIV